jgi:hypothetical protein
MSANVFANGMEISAKKDGNQSICAMPDVCLSPPSPPAGPVPLPYPNTAAASDTSEGSKTVKISGNEVGLKNSSNYKKSTGDEAATKSLGMGVVTHNIQGKMEHAAWSFDVKIEGANGIRHMDLTAHNYSNPGPNSADMILNQANQKIAENKPLECEELEAKNKEAKNKQLKEGVDKDSVVIQTASFTPPGGGPSRFLKAGTAQDKLKSPKRNGFAKPNKKATKACSDEKYGGERAGPQIGPPQQGNLRANTEFRNHTEGKIIEQFFGGTPPPSGPPGSLGTLKTRISEVSCWSCKTAVCTAADCGLEIILCNDKNEEVKTDDVCNGPEPKRAEGPVRGPGDTRDLQDRLWRGLGL